MESNFNNRDFEHYVKRNADQYRMIPSEKVWKGINNVLHTRRKWYGVGLTLLLLTTAVSVTWVMVSYPAPGTALKSAANPATTPGSNSQPSAGSPLEKNIGSLLTYNKAVKQNDKAPFSDLVSIPAESIILPATENKSGELIVMTSSPVISSKANTEDNTERSGTIFNNIINTEPRVGTQEIALSPDAQVIVVSNNPASTDQTLSKGTKGYSPETIESVVSSYQAKKLNKKLFWQIYFMPTVSYRKLSENKSFQDPTQGSSSYPFASSSDINGAVTHRSDMGLELGVSTKYPLSKNLKLTGGLQFNVNKYDIKAAYLYSGEQATISLNGGNGNDLVTTWTNYRNYNGSRSDWLKNFYFSVSAPVGAELKLFGNDKTNFGIAGTVQPTYILRDRAYVISSDYKNYAEIPGLIRHVNVNTSFETFISYTGHKTRWQIGPQIRYQVLSSFKDKYPVKENLFDYGVKIGITLNP